MIATFRKNNKDEYIFVIAYWDWEQLKANCFVCDKYCVNICPVYYTIQELKEMTELNWKEVPRSFLAFCFSRCPMSFAKEGIC